MSYAHDMGHDCPPDLDDPFWDDEDDVLEVFGKVCSYCGADKLHWEDYNGCDGIWTEAPRWRLYDKHNRLHRCPHFRQPQENAEQINPQLEDNWWQHLEDWTNYGR